jgi:hypothetical protein
LNPGAREDADDEGALAGRVGRHVPAVFLSEPQLQRLVLGGQRGVGAKRIAEGDPLAPQIAAGLGEMEAVRSLRQASRRLLEMVRDTRPVRCVDVRLLAQGPERRSRLTEVTHAGHRVDDWLGGEAGNGGRADVVDTALEPGGELRLQERALGFEASRPLRVVRDDVDSLARHQGRLAGWSHPQNRLARELELDPQSAIFAGFSQGGRRVLEWERMEELPDVRRFIGVAPGVDEVRFEDVDRELAPAVRRGVRAAFVVGEEDWVLEAVKCFQQSFAPQESRPVWRRSLHWAPLPA